MNILITGASGFIGSHLTRALSLQHEVVACVRNPQRMTNRFVGIKTVTVDFSANLSVDDWLPLLEGVDVVINAVGILRETRRQTFELLHHQAPCSLFQACEQATVRKVIQISALGADETAFSQYHLSKKAADDDLQQRELDWVIIKPSLVYGPGGKSAAFFKALSALPLIPVVDTGEQRVQPIHIDDLTDTICALLTSEAPVRLSIDAVGSSPISIKDMLLQYRHWFGIIPENILHVPYPLALLAGKVGGFLGNSTLSGEAIQMLSRGNTGDVSILQQTLQISPRSLATALCEQPAEQADRWHARLFFLRPFLRISIGLLWLFTGMVSLGLYPIEQSYALLSEVGVHGWLAPLALFGAALLDMALGVATLSRFRIQLVGKLQIILMLGYSILISMGLSEMWLHPFGPITKNVPLIIATMIMLSLEKD